jgi:hypothetical protein
VSRVEQAINSLPSGAPKSKMSLRAVQTQAHTSKGAEQKRAAAAHDASARKRKSAEASPAPAALKSPKTSATTAARARAKPASKTKQYAAEELTGMRVSGGKIEVRPMHCVGCFPIFGHCFPILLWPIDCGDAFAVYLSPRDLAIRNRPLGLSVVIVA